MKFLNYYHGEICAYTDLIPQSLQDEFLKGETGPLFFDFVRAPVHLFYWNINVSE